MKLAEIKAQLPKKMQLLQAVAKEIGMRVRFSKTLSSDDLERGIDTAVKQVNNDASYYRSSTPYPNSGLSDYCKFVNHAYSLLKNALSVTAWEGHAARFIVDMGLKGLQVTRPVDERS